MDYLLTFEDGSETHLSHHGVKGMKWGVWNEETRARYNGGGTLKKGTEIHRVALSKKDPTYFQKKHVSVTPEDHDKWVEYLGEGYSRRGINTYDVMYKTTKDLKVASEKELGKLYVDKILSDSRYKQRAMSDTDKIASGFLKDTLDTSRAGDIASGHLAMQTKTGKIIVEELLKEGYSAVPDIHGQNVADAPLIILDPDKNLRKVKVRPTRYHSSVYTDYAPAEKLAYTD